MLRPLLRDHRARFAAVGVAMTLLHLVVFRVLEPHLLAEVANAAAFVVVTQVNFGVSYHWTWASRRTAGREPVLRVARRMLVFNASVLVAFLVNSAAFWAGHRLLGVPPLVSVLAATAVSAVVSYLVSSRVVFARSAAVLPPVELPTELSGVLQPVAPSRH